MCDKLNTIYMNARSVKSVRSNINKITEMHNLIAIYQPHLLAVTETLGVSRSVKSVKSNINKITEMHNLIAIYQPHLLAVTETLGVSRSVKSVRSNINKITEMHNLIAIYQPHLLAVTETWLNLSILSTELFPHNYVVHRRDREEIEPGRVGGGVMLAVSDIIHSE